MKITLPLPPNLANSRYHWRVKHNKRKAYFEACDITELLPMNREVRRDWRARSHVRLRATIYCGGMMDTDNALARLKWPVDWMVEKLYLVGDNPIHLSWDWPIKQVVKRKQQYRVEFELEAA